MYDNTVTLFNYHAETELWYPTVFKCADIGIYTASSSVKDGKTNSDTVNIIIHCDGNKTFTAYDGTRKTYLKPKVYALCDNPDEHITFKPESDFIYDGEWSDLPPCSENDYESVFYHYMNDKYDGVYLIGSAEYFGLIPHFEIGGR